MMISEGVSGRSRDNWERMHSGLITRLPQLFFGFHPGNSFREEVRDSLQHTSGIVPIHI